MRRSERLINFLTVVSVALYPVELPAAIDYESGWFERERINMNLMENDVCAWVALQELSGGGMATLNGVQRHNRIVESYNRCIASGRFRVYHD